MPRLPITPRARTLRPRVGIRGVRGVVLAGLAGLAACRSPAPDAEPAAARPSLRPLAFLATQAVALTPAQYLLSGDSTAWVARLGPAPVFLRSLDSALAAELTERGTARTWVMAEALARSAKRNPAFTSDPHALSAESLRHGVRRSNARLGEPLASQMRSLVALTDARFALVPVELRFEAPSGGAYRAILRLVLIDARLAEMRWAGDVSMEVAEPRAPDIVAALAKRVADLLVAP